MMLTIETVRGLDPIDAAAAIATQNEAFWQGVIRTEAEARGWRVFYIPDWIWAQIHGRAKRRGRYVGGENAAPGFPDFVLVRPPELVYVEAKTNTGTVRPAQKTWHADLVNSGATVLIWRPRDWPAIRRFLAGAGQATEEETR